MQDTSIQLRWTSPLRKKPPSFLSNDYLDQHDAGLNGVQGAEAIVKVLRMRRSVHHLILGHNELGDAGCVALFDYLRSEEGRMHNLLEISLNMNSIGDAGLWAIARYRVFANFFMKCWRLFCDLRYLETNESLTALFLQNVSQCPLASQLILTIQCRIS
jgi:Leucine Rich repeat